MIAGSAVAHAIKEFNIFLESISVDEAEELQRRVDKLVELNKKGEYEVWMKTRWGDALWWVAAAIVYNRMTLARMSSGQFRPSQLKKIQANSLVKNKTKFKRLLVDHWIAHCAANDIDPRIFEDAMNEGVDLSY